MLAEEKKQLKNKLDVMRNREYCILTYADSPLLVLYRSKYDTFRTLVYCSGLRWFMVT